MNIAAIPCGDDVGITYGHIKGSGFVYQNEAAINCDPGYMWVGDHTHAVCTSNGTWDIKGNCTCKSPINV